jgi:hypothetical protein
MYIPLTNRRFLLMILYADDKQLVALARSPEHSLEICDVVLRLLAASVVHSVILSQLSFPYVLIDAPTLAYLMEPCQSLKVISHCMI